MFGAWSRYCEDWRMLWTLESLVSIGSGHLLEKNPTVNPNSTELSWFQDTFNVNRFYVDCTV